MLTAAVSVDPDYFKMTIPEWSGYRARGEASVDRVCGREANFLADLAQERAMQARQHVWRDSTLVNADTPPTPTPTRTLTLTLRSTPISLLSAFSSSARPTRTTTLQCFMSARAKSRRGGESKSERFRLVARWTRNS